MPFHPFRRAVVLVGAVSAALLVGVGPADATPAAPAAAATKYPVPSADPFYAAPANLASLADGAIIRSRPIDAKISFIGIDVPLTAWQVAYRTRDAHRVPITNVTTVVVPKATYTGAARQRPLVSYQAAEDSTGSQCAPSYSLRTGSNLLTGQEQSIMALGLQRGFVLAIPDHEGPDSAFMAGPQSAHVVLDGIRAALQFTPAGLNRRTPVGLWGYSGGGHATAWAAEQQRTYAPELTVAGVAFGGAPPNMVTTVKLLDGQAFASFMFGAIVGIRNAYPEWNVDRYLTAQGHADLARATNACIADFGLALAFHSLRAATTVPNALELPDTIRVVDTVDLGQATPVAPVFDYFSRIDQAIPTADSTALIARYCAAGAKVVGHSEASAEHVVLAFRGAPLALDFLAARFDGRPLTGTCTGRY